jgi:hypothetical protein
VISRLEAPCGDKKLNRSGVSLTNFDIFSSSVEFGHLRISKQTL